MAYRQTDPDVPAAWRAASATAAPISGLLGQTSPADQAYDIVAALRAWLAQGATEHQGRHSRSAPEYTPTPDVTRHATLERGIGWLTRGRRVALA